MTKHRKYKQAFRVACQLMLDGYLYGYDKDIIFEQIMKKNGVGQGKSNCQRQQNMKLK